MSIRYASDGNGLVVEMIHLLVVQPEASVSEVEKLARRYAMTGGFEVALPESLSSSERFQLRAVWEPRLEKYPAGSAARCSSLAGRILGALEAHERGEIEL
ncbi:MAG: hypothetical protein KDD70_01045 [Bdellovibrionales bacterium]|nr:hypothetical protein [Bdellovibrionales bacterium]